MTRYRHLIIMTIVLLICSLTDGTKAQSKFSVSGVVKDSLTGETMIGVQVLCLERPMMGTVTNQYGYYSLPLPADSYNFIYAFLGYRSDTVAVNLTSGSKRVDVLLEQQAFSVGELVVTGNVNRIRQAQVGVERITTTEISRIPVIFGEKDILKTMQLLPGVKSAGEGSSGFTIRGGALDQNLVLLDDAPVYNASHLFGFFSTFNSSAIKDVAVYKGNYPAQYGGRVASVVDITMKDGNTNEYIVDAGVGLISSNISFEGPIQKGRSSFLVSGRRTYADLFLLLTPKFKGNQLYFYDLNAKANVEINPNNRIFFSGYWGRDKMGLENMTGLDWGNKTATLRWNSVVSPSVFSNTSIVYSIYDYNINVSPSEAIDFHIYSKIEDWNFKQDFRIAIGNNNNLRVGLNSIYHTITPTRFEKGSFVNPGDRTSRNMWENALFASWTTRATNWLNIEAGLRLTSNTLVGGGGPYNTFVKGELVDTKYLKNGEFGKTFLNLEPRLSMSFVLNPDVSIKAAYGRNVQHLHMLSNSSAATPTDQWMGSSYTVNPTICDQVSLGYFQNIVKNRFSITVEAYYKNIQNEVDFKSGADIYSSIDIESELLMGRGRAYGLEILFKKNSGIFTGWIGYTISRTERQIEGINSNFWYPSRQDRTHDLTLVAMVDLGKNWQLSATWVYYTGSAITLPTGKYNIDGNTVYLYSDRNGYRMPDYHRLDVGATFTPKHKRPRRYTSSWNFSLYNAYGRENAYTIFFEQDPDDKSRTRATQIALFRWVPSITYNIRF